MNKDQCPGSTFSWRIFAIVSLCILLASSSIFAQTVYQSVDSQGNTTYSDNPGPGKTSVDLNNPNVPQNTEQNAPTNTPQNPPEIVTGGNPTPGTVVPTATTGAFPAVTVPPGVVPPAVLPPSPPQPGNPTTSTTKSNIPEANVLPSNISTPPTGSVPSIPNQTVIPGQTNPNEIRGQTSVKPQGTPQSGVSTIQANTPAVSYTATILSPEEGQTFQNSAQNIPLDVSITPPLVPGDTVAVLVDGKQVLESEASVGINIPWLERGPHSVQVVIHQKNGPGVSSNTVNFYQQRSSALLRPH